MGNDQSTVIDEERKMLENLYNISEGRLDRDNDHVNSRVNAGTSAANCQPSHTLREIEEERKRKEAEERMRIQREEIEEAERLASLLDINDTEHEAYLAAQKRALDSQSTGLSQDHELQQQNQPQPEKGSLGSYVQMAKTGYQELVNAIIRPPRAKYREEHLGPPAFSFLGKKFTRTDFTLCTQRGLNLQCSHWEPIERKSTKIPVVIYMHGNASARVEVLPQLTCLLSLGVAVFAFDFAGSGKSDGEHVSLGFYEREDLMCVVAHLRATDVVSTIALWGRSMGAVTALLHGDRDPSIAAMVLDSPFSDLRLLCEQMVDKARDQGITVPGFVSSVAIRMIRGSVLRQAEFDIKNVSPISHVPHCFIPALFVAAEDDDFITSSHSLSLHDAYAGDANMILVDGDHNTQRPRFMFDSVSIFLAACLQIPADWQFKLHPSMEMTSPPWRYPGALPRASPENGRAQQTSSVKAEQAQQSLHSPTRSASCNKENAIDIDEEAAEAIRTGLDFDDDAIDVEKIGMTNERQEEIQGSLLRMLGHESSDQQKTEENNGDSDAGDVHQSIKG
ncbi:hypothetical protein THAOC_15066 [Thalassiosira oceanica]|uniref:Serine aminopeptidase S33 domain-containing protein n=1 Tax=Thalassiosira oceanica TaxID=159749 RepID=K0SGY8_THAOC|nr:hypothetical protein THAOC_15066 [Thalassiosira oceanica]|eukprot:EJK64219.1 hypothetical protein THAOC_15066 [Thalassiosira oceanica]